MDESERQLLRRRKQYIAEAVQERSDELVSNVRRAGLIDDHDVDMLQVHQPRFYVT